MSRQPRQLDGTLNRFGAAVREESALHARELAQFLRQPSLIFVVVEIREMDDPCGLFANRFHDARVRMSESVDSKSGHKIEVLLARDIKKKDSLAAIHCHGVPAVGL